MAQGYYCNGSAWDYQNIDTPNVYTYTSSGTIATTASGVSRKVDVVNGLNVGSPISGTNPTSGTVIFSVPLDFYTQAKTFTVVNDGAAGSFVLVSGATSAVLLNGAASSPVTIVKLTGKTFYATGTNAWISY